MPTSRFRSASAEDQRESVGVETLSKEVFVGFKCKTIAISVQTTRFTLFAQVGQRHEGEGEEEMRDHSKRQKAAVKRRETCSLTRRPLQVAAPPLVEHKEGTSSSARAIACCVDELTRRMNCLFIKTARG
jgi:hypothetical protein